MSNHSGSESGNADGEVGLICNPVVLEYSTSIRGVLRCLLSQICAGKKLISLGAGDGTSSKGLLQSIFVLVRDCPLRLLQLMYTSLLDASGHPHVSYGVGNQRVQCSATQTGIPYSVHTMALKGGSMACSQTEIGKLVMWKSFTNNKTVALVLLIQTILVVQTSTMNTCPRYGWHGDPLYIVGGRPTISIFESYKIENFAEDGGYERPSNPVPGDCGYFLHAYRLIFHHPATDEVIEIYAPPPPMLCTSSEQSSVV